MGGTTLEQNGELTAAGSAENSALTDINRDTANTTKDLWNSDYSQDVDATLDHRILTEDGQNQIKKDAELSKNMFNNAVDKVQEFRRNLAAMGEDLPEHLRSELGDTGETVIDTLIRAGYSDEQISKLLDRDALVDGLARLEHGNGYSAEELIAVVNEENRQAPVTPAALDTSGEPGVLEPIIVTGERADANALQVAVTGLGQLQQEIDALELVDPDLAQALQLGIQLATGGPLKTAIGYAVNAGIDQMAGDQIRQASQDITYYAGAKIQQTTRDEFGQELANEQQQKDAVMLPGESYADTADGLRFAVTVLGVAGDRLGSGSSANRMAGDGGGSVVAKNAGRAANKAPDFIVSPNGTVFPVPKDAQGPTPVINPAGKQTGTAYTGGSGGANGKVDTIRIMNPTPPRGNSPGYPNGYIKYENGAGQGVDPYTGRTLPNSQSHFPVE